MTYLRASSSFAFVTDRVPLLPSSASVACARVQQVTGLIINPVVLEFAGAKGPFLILPQTIGLLVGASFWGFGCDLWGRRCVQQFVFQVIPTSTLLFPYT